MQTYIEHDVNSVKFLDYLRAISNVHSACMAPTVPEEIKCILTQFEEKFNVLKNEFCLSETLKIHVIKDHYLYYFVNTNKTFKFKTRKNGK